MKIKKLSVKNIKGIRELEIVASPIMNELAGDNGAGKSSALDSIVWAFAGKKAIDAKPIRDGQEAAEIVLETNDFVITRKFKGEKTTLKVEGKSGGKYAQGDLNKLFGDFTFDPLAFSNMKPEDQVKVIQDLAGPEFHAKIEEVEKEICAAYQERLFLGREIKQFGDIKPVELVKKMDVSRLIATRKKDAAYNEEQQKKQLNIDRKRQNLRGIDEELSGLKKRYDFLVEEKAALEKAVSILPEPFSEKDLSICDTQIESASDTNARAELHERYLEQKKTLENKKAAYCSVDRKIESLRFKRIDISKTANLPFKSVEFANCGLIVRGTPFDQLSSGEKIKASVKIGMAMNPKLRVMMIHNGSLLDKKSFALIKDCAEKAGYQFWVETVGDGHGDAILIENGEIKRGAE